MSFEKEIGKEALGKIFANALAVLTAKELKRRFVFAGGQVIVNFDPLVRDGSSS